LVKMKILVILLVRISEKCVVYVNKVYINMYLI